MVRLDKKLVIWKLFCKFGIKIRHKQGSTEVKFNCHICRSLFATLKIQRARNFIHLNSFQLQPCRNIEFLESFFLFVEEGK